jgi:Sulfotransferase family
MAVPVNRDTERGPDFICIGAQKAGTGWLYEQLRHHPDFWMPPIKELHYFDRLGVNIRGTPNRTLPLARSEYDRIRIARSRAVDSRDAEFLERFEALVQTESLDLRGYADLFQVRAGLVSGDITPGYSILEEAVIEQIADRFSSTKIIFIARDPVERAWSQLSMYVRRGLIKPFAPDDLDAISQHINRPEVLARSYPSEIAQRWERHVLPELFQIYFFDDLKRDPADLRASIIAFLGGNAAKPSGTLTADHNAKATKQKLSLTDAVRSHLARLFEQELRRCAIELGGPAQYWPAKYGL